MNVGRRRRILAPGVCVYAREKPPFPEDWEGREGDALGFGNQMVCLFGWSESARDRRRERSLESCSRQRECRRGNLFSRCFVLNASSITTNFSRWIRSSAAAADSHMADSNSIAVCLEQLMEMPM